MVLDMTALEEMTFFANARDFTINGGSFTNVGQSGIGELCKQTKVENV